MSYGTGLPRTGLGAVTLGGTAAGAVGAVRLPLPLFLALLGVTVVLIGTIMIRLTFRRKQPVNQ